MKKIKNLKVGDHFSLGNLRWIRLGEYSPGNILAVSTDIVNKLHYTSFRFGNNNWRNSELNDYLNVTFYNQMINADVNYSNFYNFPDYKTNRGTADFFRPLIVKEYIKYLEYLPTLKEPYWILTLEPYITIVKEGRAMSICDEEEYGKSIDEYIGVLPACILKENTKVNRGIENAFYDRRYRREWKKHFIYGTKKILERANEKKRQFNIFSRL